MSINNDFWGNYKGVINGVKFLYNTDISTKDAGESCPPATQDIPTNLKNRQKCIDEAHYGPLNPNEPNEDYWKAKAAMFGGEDIESAKKALCGNCAFFNQTKEILNCIAEGIGGEAKEEWDTNSITPFKIVWLACAVFFCASLTCISF